MNLINRVHEAVVFGICTGGFVYFSLACFN